MTVLAIVLLAQATQVAGLGWKPPPSWKADANASQMRVATYRVPPSPGDAEAGELAIFFFGKTGGGTVSANVDRWLRQFSPEPGAPQPSTRSEEVNGIRVTRVATEGTFASGMPGGPTTPRTKYALLGAIAEGPGGNVFFKLTGPRKTVHAASAQFDALIHSLSRR